MRRTAQGDEFRSNVHRGGRAESVDIAPEYAQTAIQAAQIMGLRVAGVDMLESEEGPKIMEVNSSPGLEGIEAATGLDVAGKIIEHLEEAVEFPDIDIRQRLTLKSGYGVAEVPIPADSQLVNQFLRDSIFADREVTVLSILRGSLAIPTPNGDSQILAGDRLICYGKLLTIKMIFGGEQTAAADRGRRGRLLRDRQHLTIEATATAATATAATATGSP